MIDKTIAVDIGMTNIDLAFKNESGMTLRMVANQHKDAPAQLRQALDLLTDELIPGMTIGVTGGRYRDLPDVVDDYRIQKVNEMQALGLGGLALTGLEAGLVVSAGTGVAMVSARRSTVEHVTGSAVGGGTLIGLSSLILGSSDVDHIDRLAMVGNANAVDIMLSEAVGAEVGRLPAHANAVNLGKLSRQEEFSHEDLAAGLVRMVAQVIAVIALNAASASDLSEIILVGHLMDLKSVRREIRLVGEFYNRSFNMPENPGFGTVLGVLAALGQEMS